MHTSGASHLGLLASKDVTEALLDPVETIRLRLKSVTLTRQWRSTTMLGDLRSLCKMGGLCECSCNTPCTCKVTHGAAQHSTAQQSAAQHSAAQCETT